MCRKKNTILTFNNIPVRKGGNQVPFSLLSNHGELFKGAFFFLSSAGKLCLPQFGNDPYPHRGLYLAHLVSAGMGSI